MRWTIQRQFLTPVIAVALACCLATSILSLYVVTRWADRREREHLDHVVAAIGAAGFPLSATVLERMSGLSGAELVVLDARGRPLAGAPWLDEAAEHALGGVPIGPPASLAAQPRIEVAGRSFFAARLPLVSQSAPDRQLSLAVLYPEERWTAVVRQLTLTPLVVGIVGALLLVATITLVARHVVQPLRNLHRSAVAISQGDFSPIALPQRNDETRDLTIAINEMAQRLSRYEAQVRQHERLRTLGQLKGGLMHQLRNAATGARMALDFHAEACPLDTRDDNSLDVAKRQLTLMESYVQRFLTLGEPRPMPQRSQVALGALLGDVASLLEPACRHSRIELELSLPAEEVVVPGDAKALEQLLLNLLFNALEAVQHGSQPSRIICARVATDGQHSDAAQIVVEDSGDGPTADMQQRLFEPFETDKPEGTGLGLATARQIADEHGGSITWSRRDERTQFLVTLPLSKVRDRHGATVDCR
ncbi:MAG TPA: HAMP domain-containing sensor histidine kinase [Pirellulales bacterium]|nr:HAMP domain-containing sensor histidine kinase [Pirellulales bacterium]